MHLLNPEQALALARDEAIKRRRSASRRERIATAALAGLVGSVARGSAPVFAAIAVEYADALIAELDKEK